MRKSNLKLATVNGVKLDLSRPCTIDYTIKGKRDKDLETHARTPKQCMVAATKMLLERRFDAAAIYDRHNNLVCIVRRVRNTIVIDDRSKKVIK
jgi:hypothetical protein